LKVVFDKRTGFLDQYFYIYFKTTGFRHKIIFYIYIDNGFEDDYDFFSTRRSYRIYLKANITDVITSKDFELDSYRSLTKEGFATEYEDYPKTTTSLRKIISDYINDYIKIVYSKKLDEVNEKFLETQKTLLKLKTKIQKRESPIDIQKYEQTFELFQTNLKEFEDFLNIIKQK
jgi:hypothetical protein